MTVANNAPAKSDDLPAPVPNREDQATPESIVNFSAIVLLKKSGCNRISRRIQGLEQTLCRGVAQSEPLDELRFNLPGIQNSSYSCCVGTLQPAAEELCGLLIDLEQCLAFFCRSIVCGRNLRDGYPALFGNDSNRLGKRHLFDQHHELENISSNTTAETMEDLLFAMNRKGGCFLRMKRAEALEVPPGFLSAIRNRKSPARYRRRSESIQQSFSFRAAGSLTKTKIEQFILSSVEIATDNPIFLTDWTEQDHRVSFPPHSAKGQFACFCHRDINLRS